MYKIYRKMKKSNATKLPFAPFSSKAGNDIDCVQFQIEKCSPFLMILLLI